MTDLKSYSVEAFWDSESGVWVATSEDVSGLATEADTLDTLNNKLRQMIPELLMLNGVVAEDYTGFIAIKLTTHRQEILEIAS